MTPAQLRKEYSDEVLPIASAKARSEALLAVSKSKHALSGDAFATITMHAIRSAFQETMSAADFNKAFQDVGDSSYDKYRSAFGDLVSSVRKSAESGSAEAVAEIAAQQKAMEAMKPTPAPRQETPRPEPTRRVVEEERPRKPRHTEEATPAPRHHSESKSGVGSAAASGL